MLDRIMNFISLCVIKCPFQVLFLLLLFNSCGTNKSATKNDYSMQVVEQAQIADTTTSKHVEKSNEEERTTELTTITKTEYDTEKPVNPDTGKPPVKSEEITQKTKEITKKAENTSETNIGLEGAQIEDKVPLTAMEKEQMFVDILPEGPEDDGIAYLSFFVEEKEDGSLELNGEPVTEEEICRQVREELDSLRMFCEIGEGSIAVDETEDIDWINNWKQYFHQFYIDDLLVIPSWEDVKPEDEDRMVLHIDPGTAFGTGMHETTQLCIRQLKKFITPETELLDVGTGSGILAILSLMYGAKHAVGTDLDPCAVEAVADNMKNNGIAPEQFSMMIGNIITEKEVQDEVGYEKYDIVVANILADVLVPLTPVIVNQLKKGGVYITSGIIDDKETVVTEAVKAAGLEVLEVTYQGEWVSVTARKN